MLSQVANGHGKHEPFLKRVFIGPVVVERLLVVAMLAIGPINPFLSVGVALSMALSIPVFSAASNTVSNTVMPNRAAPQLRNDNLVGLLAERKIY